MLKVKVSNMEHGNQMFMSLRLKGTVQRERILQNTFENIQTNYSWDMANNNISYALFEVIFLIIFKHGMNIFNLNTFFVKTTRWSLWEILCVYLIFLASVNNRKICHYNYDSKI